MFNSQKIKDLFNGGHQSKLQPEEEILEDLSSFDQFLKCFSEELKKAFKDGFYDINISCSLGKNRKREVLLRSTRSHKFIIPEEEIIT